jgi:FkbM family methyltransferase
MTGPSGVYQKPRRPRILIDAVAYSPHDGGFATAMHDLLGTCLQMREFEFVIVHDRRYTEVFRAFGLATYSVAIPKSLRFFASLVLIPLIARRVRASAVHCEISALPPFLGVPGSLTVDDLYFLIDRRSGGRSLRQRVMQLYWERVFVGSIRRAQVLKAISQTTAEDLRRLISPVLSIVLCEPSVDAPPGPTPIRGRPGPEEDFRLLFVGSVVPRRNLPFLLRALELVHRPWRLDVVGSLWWGADALGSMGTDARVHLHGYVPDSEREMLMAEAHLLIAPSRYEGFGYPVAEAMVRGLPVLASDVGAFREFVPASWRFPLDDPAALASMIDGLDDGRLSRMPQAGRDAVRRFSRENHLKSHRHLFRRLITDLSTPPERSLAGTGWRPGKLDRIRALVRRALILALGDRADGRLRGVYHSMLRKAGRFGPPEDSATKAVLGAVAARSGTILDVGANVGRYAWFLERHASSRCLLFALEPHPAAAELLRRAIGASPRCTVLEVAAADRDEIAELVVPPGPFGTPTSALAWVRSDRSGGDPHVIKVLTRRIDSLIEDGTILVAGPVFMKLDVEGAEGRVLRGAAGLLRRHRPVIYFESETRTAIRQGETPERVWDELGQAGYRIFANASGRFVSVDRIVPEVANYLAIPGSGEVEGQQSLDAAALIAIIDSWAIRGMEA